MKTITLTFNEALVLIAEGMTMNNVKTLANKLRNADAPVAATNTQFTQYDNEVVKQNLKLANTQVYDLERAPEKAKQTESVLRAEISNLENYTKQDAESLKYFRKWVEELRVATGNGEGVTTATVFSDAVSYIKETEEQLTKANNVIATVKAACGIDEFNDDKISLIISAVEAYYRGN